jgi:hypothetical protein
MSDSELYPGLDAELDAVYERNVTEGRATPAEDVAVSGLESVVEQQLQPRPPEALPEEIRQWAVRQLMPANKAWGKFRTSLEHPAPFQLHVFANQEPHDFGEVIQRLHKAQEILTGSGLKTPEGLSIGETMKLVLIPWQDFRNQIGQGTFQDWVKQFRRAQGINNEDYFNDNLIAAIEMNKPMYRNPDQPGQILTPRTYLNKKIEEDGAWGIMLVQTSEQAGLESILGKSPDELTGDGAANYQIADTLGSGEACSVDALGVFEWLALSFQEDPSKLSATTDYSWLLANRLDVDGRPFVPYGGWDVDQVRSYLYWAGNQGGGVRPRLAVS